jgi:hypothetical protein
LSPFVFEAHRARRQAIDHLSESLETAPGLHICGARRAERGEVPQHEIVDRQRFAGGPAEPVGCSGQPNLATALPQRARGNLHERQQAAGRDGERVRRARRPAFGQPGAEFARGEGTVLEDSRRVVGQGRKLDSAKILAVCRVHPQRVLQHRLQKRR